MRLLLGERICRGEACLALLGTKPVLFSVRTRAQRAAPLHLWCCRREVLYRTGRGMPRPYILLWGACFTHASTLQAGPGGRLGRRGRGPRLCPPGWRRLVLRRQAPG